MGMATGGDASDQQRFALIYRRHYALIHAYVARRLRDRGLADDVTADVFTVAWRRLDDIPSPIGGWLFGVARHVVMATNRATVPTRSSSSTTPWSPGRQILPRGRSTVPSWNGCRRRWER